MREAGLEQHLISQTVGADEELHTDLVEGLDLSSPPEHFFTTEFLFKTWHFPRCYGYKDQQNLIPPGKPSQASDLPFHLKSRASPPTCPSTKRKAHIIEGVGSCLSSSLQLSTSLSGFSSPEVRVAV